MNQDPFGTALRVVSTDAQTIVLELTVDGFQTEVVEYAGQAYDRLVIPDTVQTTTPGEPQVPTYGTLVGLPSTRNITIQLLEAEDQIYQGYRLAPAPQRVITGDALDSLSAADIQETLVRNQERFTAAAFYPPAPVELGDSGYMRDQAVTQVRFYPVQYNPVTGEVRFYRRLRVRITWDSTLTLSATAPGDTSPAYEEVLRAALVNYDTLERPAAGAQADPTSAARTSVVPTSTAPALKIGVIEDGVYKLTYADLTRAGFDLGGGDPRTLKLTSRGKAIPLYVHGEGDGVFDTSDYILFYGTAIDDIYTARNVYWLTAGGNNGQRIPMRDGSPAANAATPTHFPTTLHAEENTYYWQTMPNGEGQDHWFWGDKLSAPESRSFALRLEHISTTADQATVRVRLKGRSDILDRNPDHHTRIYLNGVKIDDQRWDGQIIFDHQVTVSHASLKSGDNTVRVESVGDTGASVDQVFVDWIAIDYWDSYSAENDTLLFGAPAAQSFNFRVSGFTNNEVAVFDITDPDNVKRITNLESSADGNRYTIRFKDTAQPQSRYLALTAAQYKTPADLALDQPSAWKDSANKADYIIITHADFYASALRLASHRRDAGLQVATVKVEDIYDEFNAGIFNPQAIRDFLSFAYRNWSNPRPTYVVLLGDANQDYRNYKTDLPNYVPAQIVQTELLGDTPSDNWFVTVSGDDVLPDMFIGRLSAQTRAQADAIVDKIIRYDRTPPGDDWNKNVLLVADDDEAAFKEISEQIAALLPRSFTSRRLYIDNYPPGDPTADITTQINAGSILVNYTGHGKLDGWGTWPGGDNRIFDRPDVARLNNTHKLPVVTVANCLNGLFTGSQDQTALAEEFQRLPDKGAIAVWAATGLDYPSGHRLLMSEFYEAVFQDYQYGLGAATTMAKVETYAYSSEWASLVNTFVLFGDPATPIGLPKEDPYVIETIPAVGAANVAVNQELQIVFNKPMNPDTVVLSNTGTRGLTLAPAWDAKYRVLTYAHTGFGYDETRTFTIQGEDEFGTPLNSDLGPVTWSFTTTRPPAGQDVVTISGPTTGATGQAYTFGAVLGSTVQPTTYVWQAAGQQAVTHTNNGFHDTVTFTWTNPGDKVIIVTTTNANGSVADTHKISVIQAPLASVALSGSATGQINTAYTFRARVSPTAIKQPISYVWEATGHEPVTRTGGLSDEISFTWKRTGVQVVTVTATNADGTATGTYLVTINSATPTPPGTTSIYLPVVMR